MINPLSSYNVAYDIQRYISDTINSGSELSTLSVEVYPENSMEIEYQIRNSLQKQGIAVVVMTPSMTLQGNDGVNNALAMDEIEIIVTEYVPVNRAKNKIYASTALDVCTYLSEFMTGRKSPFGYGSFSLIGIEQGEDNSLLVCKLRFKTYVTKGN